MEAILAVKFFANSLGTEPERDWLKDLVAIGGPPRRWTMGGQD